MKKSTWRIFGGLVIVGLLSGFLNYTYATGFLLGAVVSAILYLRNDSFWNDVVDTGVAGAGTGSFHFIINYGLMAGSMILCAKFPQYGNIFACAIGLAMVKLALIVDAIINKGKEEEE